MRYRRFGRSDLEVSEVGFGVWTLASDWWGVVEDKQGLLHAALDAGINFIDTAPVYGEAGVGEELLADVLKAQRDEIVLTTKCGYDIDADAQVPGPVGAPARLGARRRSASSSKRRCAGSAPTTSTSTSCTTRASSRSSTTSCGRSSRSSSAEGKVRELGVALGPAIGWVDEGLEAIRDRADRVAADGVQRARAGAGPHVRGRARRSPTGASGSSPACRTRPTRSRAGSRATPCSRRATTARTATATTCSTTSTRPRRSRSSGRAPAARSARPRSPASSPNPAFTTVLPTCVTVDDVQRVRGGVRPAAHRRREGAARRALGRQLRRHQPLRDAAEVEHRRVTDARRRRRRGSRPTSGAASSSTSRASSSPSAASTRPRWTTSRSRPGVTKPVFYQHFPSKRALFVAVLEDVGGRLLDGAHRGDRAASRPGARRVEQGFAAYFRFVENDRAAFRLLFGASARNDAEFADVVDGVLDDAAAAVSTLIEIHGSDEHRLVLAHAIVGMAEGISRHAVHRSRRPARPRPARRLDRRARLVRPTRRPLRDVSRPTPAVGGVCAASLAGTALGRPPRAPWSTPRFVAHRARAATRPSGVTTIGARVLTLRLSPEVASATRARDVTRTHLAPICPDDVVENAALVVTELVSNVVVHALTDMLLVVDVVPGRVDLRRAGQLTSTADVAADKPGRRRRSRARHRRPARDGVGRRAPAWDEGGVGRARLRGSRRGGQTTLM